MTIQENLSDGLSLSISQSCQALEVSRSGYYKWNGGGAPRCKHRGIRGAAAWMWNQVKQIQTEVEYVCPLSPMQASGYCDKNNISVYIFIVLSMCSCGIHQAYWRQVSFYNMYNRPFRERLMVRLRLISILANEGLFWEAMLKWWSQRQFYFHNRI